MSEPQSPPPPPAGFQRSDGRGAFTTHNGPLFHRPGVEGSEQAFFAQRRHCNGLGLIHGGMLSAFLDGLLASAAGWMAGATPITLHYPSTSWTWGAPASGFWAKRA